MTAPYSKILDCAFFYHFLYRLLDINKICHHYGYLEEIIVFDSEFQGRDRTGL